MKRVGCFEAPDNLRLACSLTQSIYALYWRDTFLGNCVAISSTVLISAGHHYNAKKDDIGEFSVLVGKSRWVGVEYGAKNGMCDVLVLWLNSPVVYFSPLRGYLPGLHARVATVWLSPKPPHDPIVSPGVVVESNFNNCTVRGTVSTSGSSGAPVVDFFGENVVGLHLTSDTKDGSRVSGFIPARKLISILAEMDVYHRA